MEKIAAKKVNEKRMPRCDSLARRAKGGRLCFGLLKNTGRRLCSRHGNHGASITYNAVRKVSTLVGPGMNDDNEAIVHQLVKVQAQVVITPLVKHGTPTVYCIAADLNQDCNCDRYRGDCCNIRRNGECSFTLTQVLCIEIPIAFDVDVDVNGKIACCGKADLGPCCIPPKKPCAADLRPRFCPFDD